MPASVAQSIGTDLRAGASISRAGGCGSRERMAAAIALPLIALARGEDREVTGNALRSGAVKHWAAQYEGKDEGCSRPGTVLRLTNRRGSFGTTLAGIHRSVRVEVYIRRTGHRRTRSYGSSGG